VHPRAADLIASLKLSPHPEGGHFREIYRSSSRVQPGDERGERSAVTTIYFLLAAREGRRWHRVASVEVWNYYVGEPLELLIAADASFEQVTSHRLGPVDGDTRPVHVVPAHTWQAARSTGAYTLVGCTVGPGFEFEDFQCDAGVPP